VNARFSDNLLDEEVLGSFIYDLFNIRVLLLFLKHVERKTIALLENLIYKELVLAISMRELDDFLSGIVNMRLIIVFISDGLFRRH